MRIIKSCLLLCKFFDNFLIIFKIFIFFGFSEIRAKSGSGLIFQFQGPEIRQGSGIGPFLGQNLRFWPYGLIFKKNYFSGFYPSLISSFGADKVKT